MLRRVLRDAAACLGALHHSSQVFMAVKDEIARKTNSKSMTKAYCMRAAHRTFSHAFCGKAIKHGISRGGSKNESNGDIDADSSTRDASRQPGVERRKTEEEPQQASVKEARVTVDNHSGDPAKTLPKGAGRPRHPPDQSQADSSSWRVVSAAWRNATFSRSGSSNRQPQVSVKPSRSAPRVAAGAQQRRAGTCCVWSLATRILRASTMAAQRLSQLMANDTPATAVRKRWAGHRYERHPLGRFFFSRPGSDSVSPRLRAAPAGQCGVSEGHCS
ncbi:hypothetical protein J3F83DRAFT_440537 [Trichoderma novae-zelandiae]